MNEEYDNSLSDDQTIKGIIIDLRLVVDQLGKNFMKAKDLIHELARRLDESKRCERDQVSRKIKEILKDKIREGKITAKWIEDCLPPEYKRKYTTKSEDTSLSKENMKEIEVDASGNSEIESAATSDVVNYEGRPPDIENLNTDASPVGKDLEVMSELEAYTPDNYEDNKSFDVQFEFPFEELRSHMQSSLRKNSAVSEVLFAAKVDVVNRRLTDIRIGEQQFDSN